MFSLLLWLMTWPIEIGVHIKEKMSFKQDGSALTPKTDRSKTLCQYLPPVTLLRSPYKASNTPSLSTFFGVASVRSPDHPPRQARSPGSSPVETPGARAESPEHLPGFPPSILWSDCSAASSKRIRPGDTPLKPSKNSESKGGLKYKSNFTLSSVSTEGADLKTPSSRAWCSLWQPLLCPILSKVLP